MARRCSKCDDQGAVELERKVTDKRTPLGYRMVSFAYRCDCPKGAERYPKLALLPDVPVSELDRSVDRHPSGAAPEGLQAKLDDLGRKLGVVKPEQQTLEEDDEPF